MHVNYRPKTPIFNLIYWPQTWQRATFFDLLQSHFTENEVWEHLTVATHTPGPVHHCLMPVLRGGGIPWGDETYQLGDVVFEGMELAQTTVHRVLELQRGFDTGH